MPTCAEAVIVMLACARVGAIHLVVSAGFGAGALGDRLRLSRSATGSMLHVINSSTGTGAQGVHVTNSSATAPALQASNTAAGQAAVFNSAGLAAAFNTPFGQPPFTVVSATMVGNLNAACLDGQSAGAFLPLDGTVFNSVALAGHLAADYQLRCGPGTIQAFTQVPASGSFSSTYTLLTSGFTCRNGNFAKRAAQGDYRVLFCGIDGSPNPVALATDDSFNDFVGVQLVSADSDAVTTCSGVGTSVPSEFKVTTRNTSGVGRDAPFTIAQLGT